MDYTTPSQITERRQLLLLSALSALLVGCASSPAPSPRADKAAAKASGSRRAGASVAAVNPLRLAQAQREALLARTMLVVNTPYTFGGNSPEGGFDCSGLIQWAVQGLHTGRLPRTTSQWAQASSPLGSSRLQRGDFVFFNTLGGRYSHMGVFVGNGQFVHAPSSGGTVQRVRMDNPYFAQRFTEARSIFA